MPTAAEKAAQRAARRSSSPEGDAIATALSQTEPEPTEAPTPAATPTPATAPAVITKPVNISYPKRFTLDLTVAQEQRLTALTATVRPLRSKPISRAEIMRWIFDHATDTQIVGICTAAIDADR